MQPLDQLRLGLAAKLMQVLMRLDQRFLNQIRRIKATLQPWIEVKLPRPEPQQRSITLQLPTVGRGHGTPYLCGRENLKNDAAKSAFLCKSTPGAMCIQVTKQI